jgi:hypothetical protein
MPKPLAKLKNNINLNVTQMMAFLNVYKTVDCASSKNRGKLYQELKKENIAFKVETIGFNKGVHSMDRSTTGAEGWRYGRLARLIREKRLTQQDVEDGIEKSYCKDQYNINEIKEAFQDGKTEKEIIAIIVNAWHSKLYYEKYTPFDHSYYRNLIKRITIEHNNVTVS